MTDECPDDSNPDTRVYSYYLLACFVQHGGVTYYVRARVLVAGVARDHTGRELVSE